ncbi:MAG: GntR family transcriptional regulator [Thermoproteus sp.]
MLHEKAYRLILEAILDGRLPPGRLLKEEHLSAWLGMSRTPIREALARLERDGFVVKRGRSYAVALLSKEEVLEMYEVRIPLEMTSAKLAALRAPSHVLDKLKEIVSAMSVESSRGASPDPLRLMALGGAFHEIISEGASNKFLRDGLANIRMRLTPARLQVFLDTSRRRQEVEEHRAVFEAIASRNQSDAEYYMELHETNVLRFLRDNFAAVTR